MGFFFCLVSVLFFGWLLVFFFSSVGRAGREVHQRPVFFLIVSI